jgi:putative nucleotidyltransferase with HDIG domain
MSEKRNLLQLIEDSITSGEVSLPPANGVLGKLQQLTADPDFDLNEAVEVITRDQSLTAEILKVANSSFYGGLTEITTVKNAAVRLGAPEVVRLATLVSEKKNYRVESPHLKEFIEPLWQHSMAVAQGAGWLAKKLGYPNLVNEAFVAGLMHDVGSMALVRVLDDLLRQGRDDLNISPMLVIEIIETSHTKQGALLAEHWGLPQMYVDVIRKHHGRDLSEEGVLMNLVALADKAAAQLEIGLEKDTSIVLSASEEAYTLGAGDILLAQLSVMLEDSAVMA